MSQRPPSCQDVRAWLRQRNDAPDVPPNPIAEHVATCAHCRGAVLVLASALLGRSAVPETLSCQEAATQLAPFIEQEAQEGSAAAIRAYGQLWWHLWTCRDCAETYTLVRQVFLSQHEGEGTEPDQSC